MAQPRSQLVSTDTPSTFHCVQRCVRRAFLCGIDDYTGQSFEHRKHWVQARIALVATCFAADVLAYAVMSNHLHIVYIWTRHMSARGTTKRSSSAG